MQFDIKKIANSTKFTRVIGILGGAIIIVLVFHAGVVVGYHKAKFSFSMGEKYYRAFDGRPEHHNSFDPRERGFPTAHGAIGKVIRADLPTLVILGPDNIEKTVIVASSTPIRQFRGTASTSDLVAGVHVVVFGSPNDDAQVMAELIRIIPPPPQQ